MVGLFSWSRISLLSILVIRLSHYARAGNPAVDVTFPEKPAAGHAMMVQDNFLGISFELSSFDTLCKL